MNLEIIKKIDLLTAFLEGAHTLSDNACFDGVLENAMSDLKEIKSELLGEV